jgi:hypothetical protein
MVDMEKAWEHVQSLAIIIMMGGMFLAPTEYKQYFFYGGFAVFGFMIFYTEVYLKEKAAKYPCLRLIIRPSNKIAYFFIKQTAQGIYSRLVNPDTDLYETAVDTEEKVELPYYGISAKGITLQHQLAWEKRILFMPGRTLFRGCPIEHRAVATITVWEKRDDPERLDHLMPRPTYVIAEAPQDYHLINKPLSVDMDMEQQEQETTALATQAKGGQITISSCTRCDSKKSALEYKTRYENEHQRTIRLESQVGQMKNEFHGLTGKEADTDKLLFEREMTHLSAHIDIHSAVTSLKKSPWFQITRNVVILVLGGLGIYELATNTELRLWISGNQTLFLVPVIAISAVAIYIYSKRRG